ncbi:ATP synthase F1 subunit epsilon [Microvirga terricola]|uniref:ATP synthase epsilon chain n=1 Tax=Microvirga terricola TaxID=2719797 RepID=A0ABX0VGL8_9HYPH|nr:ATP synthase F1 subunit epsilon [Microvirga terricola]NIX77262.1 ATP synthase F1 subunit epsilon [Microvirga terricola]
MAVLKLELLSPERVILLGEAEAVMLPGVDGDMTILPGHAPLVAQLQAGLVVVTDAQGHGQRAFVGGGLAEITGASVTVLANRALPPEELSRERLEEEILHFETLRDAAQTDSARREADLSISRLRQVQAALKF